MGLRSLFVGGAALLVALSITASAVSPPLRGLVSGGIRPCDALGSADLPHYASGTVTVLEGQVTWRSSPGTPEYVDVLPTTVVAQESVPTNGMYRFDLAPGRYVLEAAPRGSYGPYATVTVNAGDDLPVDIPNECI
jgi:hypothetical protein